MKSVVKLWVTCLREAGHQHCVRTDLDEAYALSRIEDEGLAFLAITLPAYEKDILTAVSRGWIGSDLCRAIKHRRGGLPTFLLGFLRRIFDDSGLLRSDADFAVFRSLRQVLLLCSKLEADVSKKRQRKAFEAYVQTDAKLEELDEETLRVFSVVSRRLLGDYLRDVEFALYSGDWAPRHSSGQVAERLAYNQRFSDLTWTERLNEVFPFWDDLLTGYHDIVDRGEDVRILAQDEEPPSRVSSVPKTMKAPRIICMEPTWMMFVQQGIFAVMTSELQQRKHEVLYSYFNWMDQEPNRELARIGSIDGSFATLDLSEASDRVSLQLVEALLRCTPFLRKCVLACRSRESRLPDGRVVTLRKFASMGSALCFPIESMVFFIIEAISMAKSLGIAPEEIRMRDLPRMRVYGDDLIVPSTAAQILKGELETYGLKVNTRKSFTTGLFRESCGADWYSGIDVSVFRLRHAFPTSRHQWQALEKTIEFHNAAYGAGWFLVAAATGRALKRVFPRMPRVFPGTDISALWDWDGPVVVRSHPSLQRVQVKAVVFRRTKPMDPLDGYGALKKFMVPHALREAGHLERDGRSRCVGVNIGWVSVPY